MEDPKYKVVELSSLHVEDGAKELFDTPLMQPYARYVEAVVLGRDTTPEMEEITRLPLHQRYVWRVASALKWGFADFDTANVAVDRMTLSPEDSSRLMLLLKLRPMQFCLFTKELFGAVEMERLMMQAVDVAKQQD